MATTLKKENLSRSLEGLIPQAPANSHSKTSQTLSDVRQLRSKFVGTLKDSLHLATKGNIPQDADLHHPYASSSVRQVLVEGQQQTQSCTSNSILRQELKNVRLATPIHAVVVESTTISPNVKLNQYSQSPKKTLWSMRCVTSSCKRSSLKLLKSS